MSNTDRPVGDGVCVIITVRDDKLATQQTLRALSTQTRTPDEVIVVDGGSTDGTLEVIRSFSQADARVKLVEAPGANISAGRNIGIREATSRIIATTDAGCRLAPTWLAELTMPFRDEATIEFVAGFYEIEGETLLERVVGLATMRGQLDPVDPERFNPSARSMAFTKAAWQRAGGFPEWIRYSEDTLFDHKMRALNVNWRFAPKAIVSWRPRTSFRSIARQFYNYGTGRGHTQIDAVSLRYNLRNFALTLAAGGACVLTPWALLVAAFLFTYFYVLGLHRTCYRVARKLGNLMAYPVCLVVMWVVLAANTYGYVVGTAQRKMDGGRYRDRMTAYLSASC